LGAPSDGDHLFQLMATTGSDWWRPPVPNDGDRAAQGVEGCDGLRWVILESAW